MFLHACDSVHRGVCLSACWDTDPQGPGSPPWEETLLRADTPLEQTPPLPGAQHAERYGQ